MKPPVTKPVKVLGRTVPETAPGGEGLYQTLFELSPDGILLEDLEGNILDVNQALCAALGYAREELVGRNVRLLVPPEGQAAIAGFLEQLRAGERLEHEVWNLRRNGERCLVRITEQPLKLPDGRRGVLVVTRDITQSKRAELLREVFLSLGARLSTARTPLEATRAVYAAADQLWHWDAATLDLYSPGSDCIQTVLNCDTVGGERRELPAPATPRPPSPRMLRVMRSGAELIPRYFPGRSANDSIMFGDQLRATEAKMCVPIRRDGQPIGVLSIQSYTPDAYSREDLRTLQALADHCAGALERIRASEVLQQREQLNRVFLSLGAKLSAARSPAVAARAIYASADLLWRWDCGVLDLEVPGTGLAETVLAYDAFDGQRCEVTPNRPLGPPSELFRRVLAEGAILVLRQPGEALRGDTTLFGNTSRRSASLMFAPVRRENRSLGVLSVQSYEYHAFSREDLNTLQALADYCGGALERLASEAALRESEARYHSLVHNLNVGVYRLTPGPLGRFLEVNPALARMYGYESVAELQQTLVSDHYQNPQERPQFIAEVMRRGSVSNHEMRLKRKDGTAIWCSTSATAHRAPDGQVAWIDGVLEDITERKRDEFLLQVQRDLGVRLSLATTPEAAFESLLDIALQIRGVDCGGVYLLEGGSRAMNLVAHRGVSQTFAQAIQRLQAKDTRSRRVRQGQPVFAQREPDRLPAGDPFRLEGLRSSAFLPLSHEAQVLGALVLGSHHERELPARSRVVLEALAAQAAGAIARIRAESEQHRLQRQLLEISDREQARIGQDIHDGLCQQLVSLAFDANSLRAQLEAQTHPQAAVAQRIADLLDRAITESRQLSRGLFPIRLEKEGLVPALEELARSTANRAQVRCRFSHKAPALIEHSTIATHLYRIAQEAVNNGLKHSRAQAIAISLRARDGQLELRVEDDGSGFSPEAVAKTDGIGLHIMEYRARSIGGTLRVGSRPGGGTRVCCLVPSPAP